MPEPLYRTATVFDHRWFLDIAWIWGHPCIRCELAYAVDEWFLRLVRFDHLLAQPPKVVCLGKCLIMQHEEHLQCRRIGQQIGVYLFEPL